MRSEEITAEQSIGNRIVLGDFERMTTNEFGGDYGLTARWGGVSTDAGFGFFNPDQWGFHAGRMNATSVNSVFAQEPDGRVYTSTNSSPPINDRWGAEWRLFAATTNAARPGPESRIDYMALVNYYPSDEELMYCFADGRWDMFEEYGDVMYSLAPSADVAVGQSFPRFTGIKVVQ